MPDRLITVAIHTYEQALILKSLLEAEGLQVWLQNVNLLDPVVSAGVRVRIHEADLPLALRIIEGTRLEAPNPAKAPQGSPAHVILVPVDGSPHSMEALKAAFRLASSIGAEALLLHVFMTPLPGLPSPMAAIPAFEAPELAEAEETSDLEAVGRRLLQRLSSSVKQMIARGELPPVRFATRLEEGVPEEAINQVARETKPVAIVMGTRGADRKERDMIGSVTAEVLDTTRSTVVTIPAETPDPLAGSPLPTLYFSSLTQGDILALDALYRLFPAHALQVTLVALPAKRGLSGTLDTLLDYCREHYPRFAFAMAAVDPRTLASDVKALIAHRDIRLLAMPNRRHNVFARIFNPTLPHRLLDAANLPMAVIPVP